MINIIIKNNIQIKIKELSIYQLMKIKRQLTFENPKYIANKKYGYSTWNVKQFKEYYKQDTDYLYLPKAFPVINIIENDYKIIDQTYESEKQTFSFIKDLFPYQQLALKALAQKNIGMLEAPCSSGKTTIALALLAQRQQHTIILVHTEDLLKQWINAIEKFLAIPKNQLGIIGLGKFKIKPITIGLVQTLSKRKIANNYFGMVIQDENHHIAADSFIKSIQKLNCKYQLGLTATPYRKDGLCKLLQYYIGGIIHTITDEELIKAKRKIKVKIEKRTTDFIFHYNNDFNKLLDSMIINNERNKQIITDIQKEVLQHNYCLVLSHRVEHCTILQRRLQEKNILCKAISGKTDSDIRESTLKNMKEGKLQVLLATGQLAGEGLDLPILNRLFLVTPNTSGRKKEEGGKLTQYLGRIARVYPGKKDAIVYDYVDIKIGVCWGMWLARRKHIYNDYL